MDDKELERELKAIHDNRTADSAKRMTTRAANDNAAKKWLEGVAKPALDRLAAQLKKGMGHVSDARVQSDYYGYTLRIDTPIQTSEITYFIQLAVSDEGVAGRRRFNFRGQTTNPPDAPDILEWTQDDIFNEFLGEYANA